MIRYGLRGQLLLNLGMLMAIFMFLLSLLSLQISQIRFQKERTRYIRLVSGLIHETLLGQLRYHRPTSSPLRSWRLQLPAWNRIFRQPHSSSSPGLSSHSLPLAGAIVDRHGRLLKRFGPIPPQTLRLLPRRFETLRQKSRLQRTHYQRTAVVDLFSPLYVREHRVGGLWLRWHLGRMSRDFFHNQGLLLLYMALYGLGLLLVAFFFLERRLVRPLLRLVEATARVARGRPSGGLHSETIRHDEIGRLSRSFIEMEEQLRKQAQEREENIRDLQQAKDALERAQEELVRREKMATVGRLAAGVAHEVGNPLSAILGYAELLAEAEKWSDDERDMAQRIQRETSRIDRTIRDLLDYARPAPEEEQPGDPAQAIQEALDLLSPQKRFRPLTVHQKIDPHLPPVTLSTHRLVQILVNLLLNAADACGPQGILEIHASQPDPQSVQIVVADNGPGIPPELQQRLFEPFFTTKEPGQGIGLGLALCHSLITHAGGELRLLPTTEGASFSLRLPKTHSSPTPTEHGM